MRFENRSISSSSFVFALIHSIFSISYEQQAESPWCSAPLFSFFPLLLASLSLLDHIQTLDSRHDSIRIRWHKTLDGSSNLSPGTLSSSSLRFGSDCSDTAEFGPHSESFPAMSNNFWFEAVSALIDLAVAHNDAFVDFVDGVAATVAIHRRPHYALQCLDNAGYTLLFGIFPC